MLALLADLGVAAFTEYRISRAYRASAALNSDPEVVIGGFPFTRYALAGTYPTISIRAEGVSADEWNTVTHEATLREAELSPASLTGDLDALLAEKLDGRIIYNQTALGTTLGIPDLQLDPLPLRVLDAFGDAERAEFANYRQVLISASFPELGVEEPVQVEAETTLRDGRLLITPITFHRGPKGDRPVEVPAESQEQILRLLTMDLPATGMPLGLTPAYVTLQGGRLLIEGAARDATVTLTTG